MAIEEATYTVEAQTSKVSSLEYEIRKYSSYLVAETLVQGEFEEVGNSAFRILADYIFGNNQSKSKIAMTAPVSQQADAPKTSEKIAMTAPVAQVKNEQGFVVQFTMPKKYTLDTLPTPNDVRVKIRQIPERRVAVFRYSGTWGKERYDAKLSEFLSALAQDQIKTQGEPVFARYDPPFMPWFLRRNEIWINLAEPNHSK